MRLGTLVRQAAASYFVCAGQVNGAVAAQLSVTIINYSLLETRITLVQRHLVPLE
eukprot:COSAG01_NODE_7166_length_3322_cov_2.681353_4_plen_54_part_01